MTCVLCKGDAGVCFAAETEAGVVPPSVWSEVLGAGADGVLQKYVVPLPLRCRLSAEQATFAFKNRYGTDDPPIAMGVDKKFSPNCDNCFGLSIPWKTPTKAEVTVGAIQVNKDNVATIAQELGVAASSLAVDKGLAFMGLIHRIPAVVDKDGMSAKIHTDGIKAYTQTEATYVRGHGGCNPSAEDQGLNSQCAQYAVHPGFTWDSLGVQVHLATRTCTPNALACAIICTQR